MIVLRMYSFKLWLLILFSAVLINAQENEIEITDFFAKVYIAPNENSKFIGLAQRGERYEVISSHDTWIRIQFKNAVGWVYSSQVGPVATVQEVNQNESVDSLSLNDSLQNTVSDTSDSNYSDSLQQLTVSTDTTINSNSADQKKPSAANRPLRSTPPEQNQPSLDNVPKVETKPRNWFEKKIPQLPKIAQNIEDTVELYFKVTFGPAPVLSYLDPDAPILGMARSGEIMFLIGEGDSWCKVQYQDTLIGWIERRYGKIIEGTSSFSIETIRPILFIAGIIIVLFIIVLLIIKLRRKTEIQVTATVKKNVLIIAKKQIFIQYTLTNTIESLDRCFNEIGFSISLAKNNQLIRDALTQNSPDVVLVDWRFDRNILTSLERLFATFPGSEQILFIIYNVPDPSIMRPSRILPNMTYLGTMFSDRDIFKIVTPLIINETNRTMQKSSQSAALEGEIGDGNLLEILQFIEIGSKSGCLAVEKSNPFGLIYFNEGRIVYAVTSQGIMGRDAIFKVLNLSNGKFRFITNKQPEIMDINYSTLEILMEWTKAVDEAHGN